VWNFGGDENGKTIIRLFGDNAGHVSLSKNEAEDFIKDLTFYLNSPSVENPRDALQSH
jgi:hypothetical protein